MAVISCFGEAIIDLLTLDKTQVGEIDAPNLRQFPGGAPANVAVAVAQLGGEARFIGQVGDDAFGQFMSEALTTYQVDIANLSTHDSAKTAFSLVTLDANNERSFEFNRTNTADLLLSEFDVKDKWFMGADIFHFCSNTLTEPSIAKTTLAALSKAKKQGCLVSFDVNLRHTLWPSEQAEREVIGQCLDFVDVLKVSQSEIDYLSNGDEIAYVKAAVAAGVSTVIITNGSEAIKVLAKGVYSEITPPSVDALDTTAAGDSFIGGFLFALSEQKDMKKALTEQEQLEKMTLFAAKCGAYTAAHQGAFTAMPTLDELEGDLPAQTN